MVATDWPSWPGKSSSKRGNAFDCFASLECVRVRLVGIVGEQNAPSSFFESQPPALWKVFVCLHFSILETRFPLHTRTLWIIIWGVTHLFFCVCVRVFSFLPFCPCEWIFECCYKDRCTRRFWAKCSRAPHFGALVDLFFFFPWLPGNSSGKHQSQTRHKFTSWSAAVITPCKVI